MSNLPAHVRKQFRDKGVLRITPNRTPAAQRPATGANSPAQQAGDQYWRSGVELAKIFYLRLDARYPAEARAADPKLEKLHHDRMGDVRKILQESRNTIFQDVLNLFDVRMRAPDEESTEADIHAHDYFVSNCLYMLLQTYKAWAPEFCEADDVAAVCTLLDNIAAVQNERLTRSLLNFKFGFRRVVSPPPQ